MVKITVVLVHKGNTYNVTAEALFAITAATDIRVAVKELLKEEK